MPIATDCLDEAEEWMRLLLVPNLPVPLALRAVQTSVEFLKRCPHH